jgi:hypothetical protein
VPLDDGDPVDYQLESLRIRWTVAAMKRDESIPQRQWQLRFDCEQVAFHNGSYADNDKSACNLRKGLAQCE